MVSILHILFLPQAILESCKRNYSKVDHVLPLNKATSHSETQDAPFLRTPRPMLACSITHCAVQCLPSIRSLEVTSLVSSLAHLVVVRLIDSRPHPSFLERQTVYTVRGPYRIWAGSGREKGQFPATVRVPRGENPRDFGVERSASWRSFPRKRRPSGMFWVRMKTRQHGLVSPAPDPARPCCQDRPRSNTDRRDPRNVSARIRTRDIIPRRAMVEDEKKDGDRAVPKSPGYDGIYRRG